MDKPLTLPLTEAHLIPNKVRVRRKLLHGLKQATIVLAVIALVIWFGLSVRAGLARNGIAFDMGFLNQVAGFDISEGLVFSSEGLRSFQSSDSNASALLAGFFNTLKVATLAILLSTVLGVFLGMGRLAHNWLVRQLSFGIVELLRNTPMLIQLVFWYFAVVLRMPGLDDAVRWYGGVIFSRQGLFLPGLTLTQSASPAAVWLLVACVGLLAAAFASKRYRDLLCGGSLLSLVVSIAMGFPLTTTTPEVKGFIVEGGISTSPEFVALLLGLTVYTAAFIAEIVRGAILALARGQWEAAAALGMSRGRTYRDVVVPQVFRVVLPAFGNQYISLAKTTSLGIAIGYPDLFNVYGTVANQSGRSLEGVIVVMAAYLVISWSISGAVNLLNRRLVAMGV
ncbi:ABC transporter permease subunit [Cupriavidus consociatus]|uniref:ABC transporter permease subunit n=1 Tax=Cupriavidus consociatus TaxID=2821357 RepID=UPI001AE586A1|nr:MULTISPECIES: ABC transporter permease subunit [unclassified Cupriavidus]MBP0622339.1 ABC transporter permease subunit [Cupriavidus sp. LEh25]MDK2659020.1 ABC transporter permease subunit [Cupriavidus sp. LEh21]